MPAPEPEPPLTAAALEIAFARAGIAATPAERDRALDGARRLKRLVALLRAWNAEAPRDPG
jgi:hypothetical protein